jgi:hypothetical protein
MRSIGWVLNVNSIPRKAGQGQRQPGRHLLNRLWKHFIFARAMLIEFSAAPVNAAKRRKGRFAIVTTILKKVLWWRRVVSRKGWRKT